MNKQHKILMSLMALFLLSIGMSQAQVMIGGIGEYIDYANITNTNSGTKNPYVNISGSPFLLEKFNTGRIILKNGKMYEGPLRYDIYADQIEFRTKNDEVFAIKNQEEIKKVTFKDRQFIHFENEIKGFKSGIFEVRGEGKYLLLIKHNIELKDATAAKPYVQAKPPKFVQKKNNYLILNPDGEFIEVKNKNDLLSLASSSSEDLGKYVKKNKIRITNKESLIQFVEHLNSL